ncbi:DUF5522 domain-containing protein [Aeoliella mucimassa]|uniref:DUF5522 domain-containing protein n=1 Tax=Aeoliella mucimassa TaxID=2527972 RepID=UPI0011A81975
MPEQRTETTSRDYTIENGRLVFTAEYLLRRGTCCGSGCRHCPYRNPKTSTSEQVASEKTALKCQ